MNYINNVQPGPIDTEKTTANGEFAEILKKLMALPRNGTTIEIVEMVAYLADPNAGTSRVRSSPLMDGLLHSR
jgi:3-oxoacyl-[acyl-carrier protein] reductase